MIGETKTKIKKVLMPRFLGENLGIRVLSPSLGKNATSSDNYIKNFSSFSFPIVYMLRVLIKHRRAQKTL